MPTMYEYPSWIFAEDEAPYLPAPGDVFVVERIEGPGDFYWVKEVVYLIRMRKVGSGNERSGEAAQPRQQASDSVRVQVPHG